MFLDEGWSARRFRQLGSHVVGSAQCCCGSRDCAAGRRDDFHPVQQQLRCFFRSLECERQPVASHRRDTEYRRGAAGDAVCGRRSGGHGKQLGSVGRRGKRMDCHPADRDRPLPRRVLEKIQRLARRHPLLQSKPDCDRNRPNRDRRGQHERDSACEHDRSGCRRHWHDALGNGEHKSNGLRPHPVHNFGCEYAQRGFAQHAGSGRLCGLD